MNPTPTAIQALCIVRLHENIHPREFGLQLWGRDHPGWKRHSKAGPRGSSRGGGMNLASGAYLGKLRKAGLVCQWGAYPNDGNYLTDRGIQMLRDNVKPTRYPQTTNRAFRMAYQKGFVAASRSAGIGANPYKKPVAGPSFSRAFHRYWNDGWHHFQDRITTLSTYQLGTTNGKI